MTTLAAQSLSLSSPTLWSVLIALAKQAAQALTQTRPLSPLEAALYSAVEDFGASVLAARDRCELRTRLMEISQSEALLAWEAQAIRTLRESGPVALEPSTLAEGFTSAFGDEPLVRECAALIAVRADLVQRALEQVPDQELEDLSLRLTEVLEDFSVPETLRTHLQQVLVGEPAVFALLAPIVREDRWSCAPWLRLALLEELRDASLAHLRLLALNPDLEVPLTVLPASQRLSIQDLLSEAAEQTKHIAPRALQVQAPFVQSLLDSIWGDAPPDPAVLDLFRE